MNKVFFSVCIWIFIGFFPSNLAESGRVEFKKDQLETGNTNFYLDKNISDGPYIFYEGRNIIAKWIENDSLVGEIITENNLNSFHTKFKVFPDHVSLKQKRFKRMNYKQDYQGVEKFIALSDIHGQYNLFVDLLKAHTVIDSSGNWCFGNGHLVINGDIFDRGESVTETLWLVYQLEKQADEEGGKVHFLLGNHDVMVMEKDFRYTHYKYLRTAELMDTTYDYLYSEQTFLGRWLRNSPIMITINNTLITHAGISPQFIDYNLTPQKANKLYQNKIIGQQWETIQTDSVLVLLDGKDGPLWYRGYFNNNEITEDQLDDILKYFKKDYIVVGHTSLKTITPLFNGKVYGIDSSIKLGKYGEVLIYENGEFFRGTLNGEMIKL